MVDTRKTISLLNTNQAHRNSTEASHNGHVISFTLHSSRIVSIVFDTVYLENMYGLVHHCRPCL